MEEGQNFSEVVAPKEEEEEVFPTPSRSPTTVL
jgi:hypothetical protein